MPDSESTKPVGGPLRRRGRRGGRGRGRSRLPQPSAVAPGTSEAAVPAPESSESRPVLEAVEERMSRTARKPEPKPHGSAISQAIEEVSEIAESLRRVLDQMEEVLELTELAERQKMADEREIDSLRRALRQLQSRSRPERRHDDERPARTRHREHSSEPGVAEEPH